MYVFIVNPIAGNGRAKREYSKLVKNNTYKQMDSVTYYTEYKGHASEIGERLVAEHHPKKIKAVIIIGGDGTIHDFLNGFNNKGIPITAIGGGSGNDFIRGCSIFKNADELLEHIYINHSLLNYWLGNYKDEDRSERKFVNCIGFGFDSEVAKRANDSWYKKVLNKLLLGKVGYLIALIHELIYFKPLDISLEIDGQQRKLQKCYMVTVCNHPYFGGGMKIIPDAKIEPELFSVIIVHSISKLKILALFGTVFTGKHVHFKEVEVFKAKNITISSKNVIPYQADGETSNTYATFISKQENPIQVTGNFMK